MSKSDVANRMFKLAAALWVLWGVFNALLGQMTMVGDAQASLTAIADDVDAATLPVDYHEAISAVVKQYGFNIFCAGLVVFISGAYVWFGNIVAIRVSWVVSGLASFGYWFYIDLAGYSKVFPGTFVVKLAVLAIVFSAIGLKINKATN